VLGALGLASSAAVAAPFVLLKRCKDLFVIGIGYLILLAYGARAVRRVPLAKDFA
jgi:hypothetical protein